jgi:hypothetical protein
MNFFYNEQTDFLDSVVDKYYGYYGNDTSWSNTKYTFMYKNSNIVELIREIKYFDQDQSSTDTFSYTYDQSANAFRKANPLLYIYSNPSLDMGFFNMIIYFPEIFSVNTIASYTVPENGGWDIYWPRTIVINHTSTAEGKILTLESFLNNRNYFYQ